MSGIKSVFCVLTVFVMYLVTAGADNVYDVANIRKDFLTDQCQKEGSKLPDSNINKFLNCTRSGLAFPFSDKMSPEEVSISYKRELEEWCYFWPKQQDCERQNLVHIDPCLRRKSHVAIGYDLLTAFFVSACSNKGQSISTLGVFLRRVKTECWYESFKLIACVDSLKVANFKRDLRKITNCLEEQLLYCNTNEPRALLREVLNQIVKSYSSSGFVYLLKYDDDKNGNYSLGVTHEDSVPLYSADSSFYSSKIAYIAIFMLIAILLLIVGVVITLRLEIVQTMCKKRKRLINETDCETNNNNNNSVELVGD